MPAKKKSRRVPKPKAPDLTDRVAHLETTVAELVMIAERHGDPVGPKPKPPEEVPAAT
jgi:hypothetical protein